MSMGFLMEDDAAAVWRGPMVCSPDFKSACISLGGKGAAAGGC